MEERFMKVIEKRLSYKGMALSLFKALSLLCLTPGLGLKFFEQLTISLLNKFLGGYVDFSVLADKDWILISLGVLFALIYLLILFKFKENTKKNVNFLINHSSIETTAFKSFENEEIEENEEIFLDQAKEMKILNKKNIKASIEKVNHFSNEVLSKTDRRKNLNVFYYGLSHIPLTILLGYQISNKIKVSHAEWNQDKSRWDLINRTSKEYPKLIADSSLNQTSNIYDIVLKVEITTSISNSALEELGLNLNPEYSLYLESPKRNVIKYENQLQEYQRMFRETLDKINVENPEAKSIHLFYSGPPSLAFKIGSAISQRMDKEIFVYNFSNKETPKYKWYLKLTKSNEKIEFDIRKGDSK